MRSLEDTLGALVEEHKRGDMQRQVEWLLYNGWKLGMAWVEVKAIK
jgi:ribulose bisphosphate carboxylase small subunit